MGQQQLLLIILGVAIVATAIAVGLQQFTAGAELSNRDAITNDMLAIVANAQVYYFRPTGLGGGNGRFDGYNVPNKMIETANGRYATQGDGAVLVVDGESVVHDHISVKLTLSLIEGGWDYGWVWEHDGL